MNKEVLKIYKDIIYADKVFDVNFKNVSKVLFKEIERLNNIIKEAIEYIEQVGIYSDYGDSGIQSENDLLKILKGDNND